MADLEPSPTESPTPPAGKPRGRPRKARGAATTGPKAATRWTIRGVEKHVRAIATSGADSQGLTLGDWITEAIVAHSRADSKRHKSVPPAIEIPPDLPDVLAGLQGRLTALEQHLRTPWIKRLFG